MLSYRSSCRKLGICICVHAHGTDDTAALHANMLLTFTSKPASVYRQFQQSQLLTHLAVCQGLGQEALQARLWLLTLTQPLGVQIRASCPIGWEVTEQYRTTVRREPFSFASAFLTNVSDTLARKTALM